MTIWRHSKNREREKQREGSRGTQERLRGQGAGRKIRKQKGRPKRKIRGPLPPTHYLMVYSLWADRLSPGIQAVTL